MMDSNITFLNRFSDLIDSDPALYSDVIEFVTNYDYEGFDDFINTLIIKAKTFPMYMVLTRDSNEAISKLESLNAELITCKDEKICEYYVEKGFSYNKCYHVCYEGEKFDLPKDLDIRKPDEKDYPMISKCYHHITIKYVKEDAESNRLFALYNENEMCGFIGIHEEGSIGMLHVLENKRNMGYGTLLEKYMINKRLSDGSIPYANVIIDNKESFNLQKKLGMTFAKGFTYWIFND